MLQDLYGSIQPVDYRQRPDGDSAPVPLEVVDKDDQAELAKGTNMLSGTLVRWAEPAVKTSRH